VQDAPAVTVGIDETVGIHEAEILRLVVGGAAGGEGLGDEFVDLLAAFAPQREQRLDCVAGVADGLRGEIAEFGVRRQHHGKRVVDDDARGRGVAEARLVAEAERLEERQRPRRGPASREWAGLKRCRSGAERGMRCRRDPTIKSLGTCARSSSPKRAPTTRDAFVRRTSLQ
jgi:hypothetical protein